MRYGLFQGGEEAESATAAACSSVEESAEKSAASSPSADEQIAASVAAALTVSATTEPKEEVAAASPTTAAAYLNPAEEKKEEPTPSAPTPVPSVEDKKEEAVEKVEAVEKKVVEVSPAGGRSVADPIRVPVFRVQPVTTPSIIERKASEDLPSLPPSSPPPTPIDPSPLQQARQAAASATALAEALKLPAEAADKEDSTAIPPDAFPPPRDQVPRENRVEPIPASASPKSPSLSADLPSPTAATFVPARVEYPAVVEAEIESRDLVVKEEGQTLASNRDNEAAEIDLKIESASKSPVAMAEVSERRKSETHRVEEARPTTERDTTKRLDESLDGKNTQSEAVVKAEVECPLIIPKEVDPFVNDDVKKVHACEGLSAIGSELECSENKPLDQSLIDHSDGKVEMKLLSMVTHEMEVPDVVTTDKVMNETLPVVECQINSEINSCEGAMKTNVSPNAGHNEKVEAGTLPSTEIETNSASPAIKQHFSSENFGTEKMSFSNETAQGVESIGKLSDSDIVSSAEKYVIVETDESSEVVPTASAGQENLSKSLKQMSVGAEVTEQQKTIEPEHDYAKEDVKEETTASVIPPTKTESIVTTVNEIFINSEEGPLSVSDVADVLVEAKMAMVIPEEDSVEELTDTTESIKVIPETDEEKVENEPESDTALPTEETLISEELEDTSVPEDAPIVEPLNDIKTVDAEDMLPPPPPPEDTVIVSSQISESPSIVDTFETESIITTDEPVLVFSTTIEAEPVITSPSQIEQIEDLESGTSPKLVSHFVEREGHIEKILKESFKHELHEASMFPPPVFQFYDIPPYHFSSDTNQSSESQMLVLPEPVFENMPIPTDVDLSSLPELEDREVPSLECCPSGFPDAPVFEPPAAIEHAAASPRDLTEALLTPPVSPNSQSNVSIASGIATTAKDRPYTLTRAEDDRNDREPTGGSVSLRESTSYGRLDAELERLAAECLAKIECQEEALSVCQLSTTALSAAAQEHHQVTNMQQNLPA